MEANMTDPYYPQQGPPNPYGSQPDPRSPNYGAPSYDQRSGYGYPQPGGFAQGGGYGQPGGYPQGGMPVAGGYAPYGVDPITGEPLSDKSKVAAGLLQLFLGGFGAGRFYIGCTNIALIQLGLTILGWVTSFFIIGIFILMGVGIWVLVDSIMMFTGSVKDGQGRKLRS
jgi:TM2 domain-containing membrane protein YozV